MTEGTKLSATQKILQQLESPALKTELPRQFQERIHTELYKIDMQQGQLDKPLKNALVARTFFDYLLKPTQFMPFSQAQQALRELCSDKQISAYIRDTLYYCYDQLLAMQYNDLYRTTTPPPERFSPLSEVYRATWPLHNAQYFEGTMEIIRYPAITLSDPLPVTLCVRDILDSIAGSSPDYIPMNLAELKKHILEVDYLVVFREKDASTKQYKVAGMTTGQTRHADGQTFLRAPGIIRNKNDKNELGTILGAMIAKGSVDFGHKDLVIAGFTQNKRVMDFMKMCNPDLEKVFISGFDWPTLNQTEQQQIEKIIRAYTGSEANILDKLGIARDRYPQGNKPDLKPVPIKGLPLGPDGGVFMLNIVPKNIREIMAAHTSQTRYKNRFFGEFVKALRTIETFEKIA